MDTIATIVLLGTLLTCIFLVVKIAIRLAKGQSIASSVRNIVLLVFAYFLLWCLSYALRGDQAIPHGTDICFDDWCATVTAIDRGPSFVDTIHPIHPQGELMILHVKMSNRARGIAQKPSEPRIHIIDENGNKWPPSMEAQRALEAYAGKQNPLDMRLELNQSAETMQAFDIPKGKKGLKVLIEEGPFITELLLNANRQVFLIK